MGEFGWELHVPAEQAGHLWDLLLAPGGRTAWCRSGSASTGRPARLEKGYRAFGRGAHARVQPGRGGDDRPRVKSADFIGKAAYLAARAAAPAAVLCTLTVDSAASADGTPRYMLGGEPILALDGRAWWTRSGGRRT